MNLSKWDGNHLAEWELFQRYEAEAREQWEVFMKTGKPGIHCNIPAEVLGSWMRCRDRNLNPYGENHNLLSSEELACRQLKNKELLETAAPILREMAEGIQDTGIQFDLYDSDQYLLDRFSVRGRVATAPKRELNPGISQRETDCGTNAVCLSALLERPVQIMGYEHYHVSFHNLTCAAVPIRNESGKVIGIISVDCYCWPIHKHTLGMMIAMRRSIEMTMRKNLTTAEHEKKLGQFMIEIVKTPCITVNESAVVTNANQEALEALACSRMEMIGRSCDSIWGEQNPFSETIQFGRDIQDREVIFNLSGKIMRFWGSTHRITDQSNNLLGVCCTFKNKDNYKKTKPEFKAYHTFKSLIVQNSEMLQLIRLAKETAAMQCNVLLEGESGTGKEIFAQAIHNASIYRDGPFIVVNCGAIPAGLLESELFGYEDGAFTGAKKEGRIGKFELARGGTIFLDEINSMPLEMQVKILRTIQSKTVTRVGGNVEISINVRFISATNRDIWSLVRTGEFREDLFYRINVVTISIPPLRERPDDIKPLVEFIVRKLRNQMKEELFVSKEAYALLMAYSWPGNVRELENVLERSMILSRIRGSNIIEKCDLMQYQGFLETGDTAIQKHASVIDPVIAESLAASDFVRPLKEVEYEIIVAALKESGYNYNLAADRLQIHRNTLRNKIKEYRSKGYEIN